MLSLFVPLFLGCGELNTVLPSGNETYRPSALVGSRTLGEYSIIQRDDPIQPVFLDPVGADPDVRGLAVFFETPEGVSVSEKTRYTLASYTTNTDEDGEYFTVESLDRNLPSLSFPGDLPIGPYVMVFHVLGENTTLYKTNQSFFYLADKTCRARDIKTYLPGPITGPKLIPPELNLLLELEVEADKELDPFIVWYSGGQRFASGRVSEQKNRVFWVSPSATGFYTLRAEVFPFEAAGPGTGAAKNLRGSGKELSLPVSSKTRLETFFSGGEDNAVYWYTLRGNLEAARTGLGTSLVKTQASPPRWEPYADRYGLGVGPEDVYAIPDFVLPEKDGAAESGAYALKLHFMPLYDGIIFEGRFSGESAATARLSLALEKDELVLTAAAGGSEDNVKFPINLSNGAGFFEADIVFNQRDTDFTAAFSLNNETAKTLRLSLDTPLSGPGLFRFGAGENSASGENTADGKENPGDNAAYDKINEGKEPQLTALIDEFIITRE